MCGTYIKKDLSEFVFSAGPCRTALIGLIVRSLNSCSLRRRWISWMFIYTKNPVILLPSHAWQGPHILSEIAVANSASNNWLRSPGAWQQRAEVKREVDMVIS